MKRWKRALSLLLVLLMCLSLLPLAAFAEDEATEAEAVQEEVTEVEEAPAPQEEEIQAEEHIEESEEVIEVKEEPKKKEKVKVTKEIKEEKEKIEKYDKGLEKTRKEFVSKLSLLGHKYTKVNDEYFEELEDLLIMADIGVKTVMDFIDRLKARVKQENITESDIYHPE